MQRQCLPVTMRVRMREGMRVHKHHPVYHMHVGKQGSRGIICGKQSGQTQCPYSLRNPLHIFRLPTYFIRYLCFQTKVHNHALQLVQSILQE